MPVWIYVSTFPSCSSTTEKLGRSQRCLKVTAAVVATLITCHACVFSPWAGMYSSGARPRDVTSRARASLWAEQKTSLGGMYPCTVLPRALLSTCTTKTRVRHPGQPSPPPAYPIFALCARSPQAYRKHVCDLCSYVAGKTIGAARRLGLSTASNLLYEDITGVDLPAAGHFNCAPGLPCTDLHFNNVHLNGSPGKPLTEFSCHNAQGTATNSTPGEA